MQWINVQSFLKINTLTLTEDTILLPVPYFAP